MAIEAFTAVLLELNVRSFLQARGKVNRGIRDTLLTEPEHFLAKLNTVRLIEVETARTRDLVEDALTQGATAVETLAAAARQMISAKPARRTARGFFCRSPYAIPPPGSSDPHSGQRARDRRL